MVSRCTAAFGADSAGEVMQLSTTRWTRGREEVVYQEACEQYSRAPASSTRSSARSAADIASRGSRSKRPQSSSGLRDERSTPAAVPIGSRRRAMSCLSAACFVPAAIRFVV